MATNNRPTPETDAARAEESRVTGGQSLYLVHYRVAERLERQRDEARELARELRDAIQLGIQSQKEGDIWSVNPSKFAEFKESAESALAKAKEALP